MNATLSQISAMGWRFFISAGVVALVVALFLMFRAAKNHSLDRFDGFGLTETVERWVEAGKPEGEALTEFMRGRNYFVVSNRVLSVGGTNYVALFAITQPRSHRDATLFVTTNKVLIWLDSAGSAKIFSMTAGRP